MRLKQSLEFNSNIDWIALAKEIGILFKDYKPYYNTVEYTPDPIDASTMGPNDIFVFGSNTMGNHDGGAARVAMQDYDAVYGQAKGLQGRSYAIVTIDYTDEISVDLKTIEKEIDEFLEFAADNTELKFHVTKIGCGISGYEIDEIAGLFSNKIIPENVILPLEFTKQYNHKYLYDPASDIYYNIKSENHIIAVTVGNCYKIEELKGNKIVFNLPEHLLVCDKLDYINASETVLKNLY